MGMDDSVNSSCTPSAKKKKAEEKLMEVDIPVLELYDLGRRLGKGAYGIVWEATEIRSGRKVALKKIYDAFRNTTDSQRTYREIMFLKAFGHHPNIISVIGAHKSTNRMDLYLVFPYMRFDLHKLIDRQQQVLTDKNIRFITYQLLVALKYLHSADVIHRDLKPANILMDEKLNVKLADFGLSRALAVSDDGIPTLDNYNPQLTDYVATRWYRPPEILISSRVYTKALDMWSFGCILGEMLLRKVVFAGESTNDQLSLVLKSIEAPTDEEITEMCQGTNDMNLTLIRACLDSPDKGPTIAELFLRYDCATTDMMERLMKFSPNKRLTVQDAISHPFFSNYRNPSKELVASVPFRPPICDNIKLAICDYQHTICEMIERHEVVSEMDNSMNFDRMPLPSEYKYSKGGDQDIKTFELSEPLEPQRKPKGTPTDEYYRVIHDSLEMEDQPYRIPNRNELRVQDDDDEDIESGEEDEYQDDQEEQEDDMNSYYNNFESGDGHGGVEMSKSKPHEYPYFDDNGNNNFNNKPYTPVETYNYEYEKSNTKNSNKQSKQISILTLPSTADKFKIQKSLPLTDTLSMLDNLEYSCDFGQQMNNESPEEEDNDDGFQEHPEIVKQFKSLCDKYSVDLREELGDLNSLKISKKPPTAVPDTKHLEFISQSVFDNLTTPAQQQRKPESSWGSKKQQSSWGELAGINKYDGDIRRIQETVTKSTSFVNPYKAKGLKSGDGGENENEMASSVFDNFDAEDDMEEIYREIELRNSRSLPSQLGQNTLPRIPLQGKNRNAGISRESGGGGGGQNNFKGRYVSEGGGGKSSSSKSYGYIDRCKMLQQKRQNNPPSNYQPRPQQQQSSRLNDLFPCKEAIQSRIHQLEQRSKGTRASLSQDAIRERDSSSTDGLILINGKNNMRKAAGTKNNQPGFRQQKQLPAEASKSKFSLNPYGRSDLEYLPPPRPIVGRHYDRKFSGPSFKKTTRSFSDTEAYRQLGLQAGNYSTHHNGRPTTEYQPPATGVAIARKVASHSAYFPSFGTSHPLNNGAARNQNRVTNTGSGYNPPHNNSRSTANKYSLGNGDNNNRYPETASTIRASELFELRNNLRRESRTGSKYL